MDTITLENECIFSYNEEIEKIIKYNNEQVLHIIYKYTSNNNKILNENNTFNKYNYIICYLQNNLEDEFNLLFITNYYYEINNFIKKGGKIYYFIKYSLQNVTLDILNKVYQNNILHKINSNKILSLEISKNNYYYLQSSIKYLIFNKSKITDNYFSYLPNKLKTIKIQNFSCNYKSNKKDKFPLKSKFIIDLCFNFKLKININTIVFLKKIFSLSHTKTCILYNDIHIPPQELLSSVFINHYAIEKNNNKFNLLGYNYIEKKHTSEINMFQDIPCQQKVIDNRHFVNYNYNYYKTSYIKETCDKEFDNNKVLKKFIKFVLE